MSWLGPTLTIFFAVWAVATMWAAQRIEEDKAQ